MAVFSDEVLYRQVLFWVLLARPVCIVQRDCTSAEEVMEPQRVW